MFSIFGRTLYLTLIARRSRHYAGTRYLKRGVSVHGKVANDCEVEEIFQFDDGMIAKFASYIQHRGSIPTYWAQETSVTIPKPPILVNRFDPTFLATKEHFSDLFSRYGSPVLVLDLVKQTERKPRESLIGDCYKEAIQVINENIVPEHKIRYCALDFSRTSKSSHASTAPTAPISSIGAVNAPTFVDVISGDDEFRSTTNFIAPTMIHNSNVSENKSNTPSAFETVYSQDQSPSQIMNAVPDSRTGFSSIQALKTTTGSTDDILRLFEKSKNDVPVRGKVDIFQELQGMIL